MAYEIINRMRGTSMIRLLADTSVGTVDSITIVDQGTGYSNDFLTITGSGTGANASYEVDANGAIITVTLVSSGSGYLTPPSVSAPGGNSDATFSATIAGTSTIELRQLSVNTAIENVQSATISSLKWSVDACSAFTLSRQEPGHAVNTILSLFETGDWQHNDHDIANTPKGNITFSLTGGGCAIVILKKDANYNVDTQNL